MFSSVFALHIFKWSVVSSSFPNIVLHVCKEQGRLKDDNMILMISLIKDDHQQPSGFLNEAKEWAGELLSGQTKVSCGMSERERERMI